MSRVDAKALLDAFDAANGEILSWGGLSRRTAAVKALQEAAPQLARDNIQLRRQVAEIASKIERQAECLEGYAEQSGHHAKPVPSVFHSQASHFRTYAGELTAALKGSSDER